MATSPSIITRLIDRLPTSITPAVRRLAIASLIGQIALIGTGGAVRLTASGLGCPTWPKCTADSLTNTSDMGLHGVIEFGNRTLTVVLALIALSMLLALWRIRSERKDVFLLALGLLGSIPAQAVVGGITVLTKLNPWVVGMHFLISMALVVLATLLVNRVYARTGKRAVGTVNPALTPLPSVMRPLSMSIAVLTAIAVVLGVVVTGAGPHAGDIDAPRNGLDWDFVSHLHAIPAWLMMVVILVVLLQVLRRGIHGEFATATFLVLVLIGVQAALGIYQYYNGIPELAVGAHMVTGALLLSAASNLADLARYSPRA